MGLSYLHNPKLLRDYQNFKIYCKPFCWRVSAGIQPDDTTKNTGYGTVYPPPETPPGCSGQGPVTPEKLR